MKQILQNIKTGRTELIDVPVPLCRPGHVLIASRASLISVGTERMLVDFGKAGWIEKSRQQPEKVKQVLDKIRTDGLMPTMEAVFNKLDEPLPLGYCNAGVVLEVGAGVSDLLPGDRVASNGSHVEIICVPRNLCARISETVSDEEAAFTVLGAIALQGTRLAAPTLGERFVVFGLGLVGLLVVQLLRASGCHVLAVDFGWGRLQLADAFGADIVNLAVGADPVAVALAWTSGKGVDGVIIAASAKDDEIVHQAAQACRKRGRIILVGVVDLNLRRSDFYEKELTFQVSCSYGPGRYDEKYEQGGQDYPFGFVRWTEGRNFEAVLDAMRVGHLKVKELITHRIFLDEAAAAYDKLLHDPGVLGVIIQYPGTIGDGQGESKTPDSHPRLGGVAARHGNARTGIGHGRVKVGIIGVGNFAKAVLLPVLAKSGAVMAMVADNKPVAAVHAARKFGVAHAVTDAHIILDDPEINTIFVVVGHHLHARLICDALAAGKHVFVEKPLAINGVQLKEVVAAYENATFVLPMSCVVQDLKEGRTADNGSKLGGSENHPAKPLLMVGFNRRFSPHVQKIKGLLAERQESLCMTMTVNAGFLPPTHWTLDPERGGGRIIGEGCHFIDLLSFLADSPVIVVSAMMAGGNGPVREDRMSIVLRFADGSVGTVQYFANGSKGYPKETLEVFSEGRVIRMENFRVTRGYGFNGFTSFRTWRQDKGHRVEIATFISRVASGGPPLIPFERIVNITKASFAAVESARTGQTIFLDNR